MKLQAYGAGSEGIEQMENAFSGIYQRGCFSSPGYVLKTGTKRITLNEVEQIRGEIEYDSLQLAVKEKKAI